jgi:hypothetical protein
MFLVRGDTTVCRKQEINGKVLTFVLRCLIAIRYDKPTICAHLWFQSAEKRMYNVGHAFRLSFVLAGHRV